MFDEQPDGDPHGECALEIRKLEREVYILRRKFEHMSLCYEKATKKLGSIYALMYPPNSLLPDGRLMAFYPSQQDANRWMHEISARIRSIPDDVDEFQKMADALGKGELK